MAGLQPVSPTESNRCAQTQNWTTPFVGSLTAFPFRASLPQRAPRSHLLVLPLHEFTLISKCKFWLRFLEKIPNKQGKPPTLYFIQPRFQLPHEPQTFPAFARHLLQLPIFHTKGPSEPTCGFLSLHISQVTQQQLRGWSSVTRLPERNNKPAGIGRPWGAGTAPLPLGSLRHLPGVLPGPFPLASPFPGPFPFQKRASWLSDEGKLRLPATCQLAASERATHFEILYRESADLITLYTKATIF